MFVVPCQCIQCNSSFDAELGSDVCPSCLQKQCQEEEDAFVEKWQKDYPNLEGGFEQILRGFYQLRQVVSKLGTNSERLD